MSRKWVIVGITGATCAGKSTLASHLKKILPNNTNVIAQDSYYFPVGDPRLVFLPDINHFNFDSPSSFNFEKMLEDIEVLIHDRKPNYPEKRISNSEDIVSTLKKRLLKENTKILITEGICIFNYNPIVQLCDLKYYLKIDKEECQRRREKKVFKLPDVPGYFQHYVWPQKLKHEEHIRKNIPDIKYFDKITDNTVLEILQDILHLV